MRLTPLALAALLLAGCAEPPAAPPGDVAPAAPERARYDIPVGVYVSAKSAVVCPPPVSCFQSNDELLVELRGNETAKGFRLEVASSQLASQNTPFHIEVRCAGARGCEKPLAERDGTAPLTLEGSADLPPLSLLTVVARSLDPSPDPLGLMAPYLLVQGTVSVDAVPGPAPKLVETALRMEGVSGLCGFVVEPDCHTFPGGMSLEVPLDGALRRLDLTATWTPTSPASETMRIAVYCYDAPGCPPPLTVEGRSPLRLEAFAAGDTAGAYLEAWLQWTTPQGVPLRQPFTFDGKMQTVVQPDA